MVLRALNLSARDFRFGAVSGGSYVSHLLEAMSFPVEQKKWVADECEVSLETHVGFSHEEAAESLLFFEAVCCGVQQV
jgi:hypothetical protein